MCGTLPRVLQLQNWIGRKSDSIAKSADHFASILVLAQTKKKKSKLI